MKSVREIIQNVSRQCVTCDGEARKYCNGDCCYISDIIDKAEEKLIKRINSDRTEIASVPHGMKLCRVRNEAVYSCDHSEC